MRWRRKKHECGGGRGTYDDGWAERHAMHHDMYFVALFDGVLVRADFDGLDESVRPLRVL